MLRGCSSDCQTVRQPLTSLGERLDRAGERQVVLRDAAGVMRREGADDLGVPDVDVGMVIHRVGRARDALHEVDPGGEGGEGVALRQNLAAARPTWQRAEGTLNLEVG